MSRQLIALFAAAGLLLSGCATISDGLDAINPFASSGPKMAPLPPLNTTAEVRTVWSTSVSKAGNYTFTPAVVGNVVYVAAANGTVSRIEDGKAVWKIDAGQPLSAGVGANGRLVVVATPKGEVLAFSAEDGKALWKARVSSEVLAAPAIGDDGVAVKSGDNQVFLLDAGDGGRKWAYQRATPPLSVRSAGSPVFADRYLFVGYPGGKLVALALQNGAPVWEGAVALPKGATELDRVADIVASPVIDGRQICAVAFQGRVACFDMGQGGAMVWSRDISSVSGLAMDGRYVFVTDDKGVVYALDRLSGSSLWKQDKLKNRRLSAPVVRRGLVVVADAEGILHFLSREDGSFAARLKTDGTPVRAPLQLLGSSVLVQTSGGSVSAIEAQ
ncbi:outer membrane protein assembly factor BamB [Ferribacterium limneticum]|uniref:outer membrane protein assembly factor BamB n=1 Tax=Ferribacterium limneticum TaxID=76259 RepID=UPI001CFAAE27|nr:outer membrane protein assembly factor BamB [Ferribacterium limneticum]UCV29680.1 outer membrane protein assembly factor BamB [Ferribacterium limneticum]UCV33599.1 outer membrane protein assembly factor BamB [Ferribacterium limneticum]